MFCLALTVAIFTSATIWKLSWVHLLTRLHNSAPLRHLSRYIPTKGIHNVYSFCQHACLSSSASVNTVKLPEITSFHKQSLQLYCLVGWGGCWLLLISQSSTEEADGRVMRRQIWLKPSPQAALDLPLNQRTLLMPNPSQCLAPTESKKREECMFPHPHASKLMH